MFFYSHCENYRYCIIHRCLYPHYIQHFSPNRYIDKCVLHKYTRISAQSGGDSNLPKFGFCFPANIFNAVDLPIPFVPTRPRTCPYIYIYIYIYIQICTCMYTHECMIICTYVCMHLHSHIVVEKNKKMDKNKNNFFLFVCVFAGNPKNIRFLQLQINRHAHIHTNIHIVHRSQIS